jgi:hypothetical protein
VLLRGMKEIKRGGEYSKKSCINKGKNEVGGVMQ